MYKMIARLYENLNRKVQILQKEFKTVFIIIINCLAIIFLFFYKADY